MGPQPAGRFPSELGTTGTAISFAPGNRRKGREKLRASDAEALCSFGKIEEHALVLWLVARRGKPGRGLARLLGCRVEKELD